MAIPKKRVQKSKATGAKKFKSRNPPEFLFGVEIPAYAASSPTPETQPYAHHDGCFCQRCDNSPYHLSDTESKNESPETSSAPAKKTSAAPSTKRRSSRQPVKKTKLVVKKKESEVCPALK